MIFKKQFAGRETTGQNRDRPRNLSAMKPFGDSRRAYKVLGFVALREDYNLSVYAVVIILGQRLLCLLTESR